MSSVEGSKRFGRIALLGLSLFAFTACGDLPQPESQNKGEAALDADPLEPINRGIYAFNHTVDGLVLRPIASIYRGVVPEPGRVAVNNFLDNLYTPVVFADSVLQGDPQNSFASLWRFVINTTMGIGGIFDVASEAGLKNRPADFGQTLGMYGFGTGPYIVLPIIGPSNARDAVGRLADALMNPFNYIDQGLSTAIWAATAVNARSNNMKLIDDIYSTSLDPYSTFRSGYTQKRISDIKRGRAARDKALDQAFPEKAQ